MYLLQNSIPIANADDLVKLIKSMDKASPILKKLSCGRTKCSAIISNVIGEVSKEEIFEIMRKNQFSLIIDESTDTSTQKHLALVVRTLHNDEVHDFFAGLIDVDDQTRNGIFQSIVTFFEDNNIPYLENMVGFANNGAAVMVGSKQEVAQKFKSAIPHLFIQKCICHSLALCAAKTCEKLPLEAEEVMKSVYLYLRYSSKRLQA